MALFDPLDDGPYEYGTRLELRIAGAESNFAIAVSRLGIGVSWISCIGCDPFGDVILTALKSEGVDISRVRRDPEAPTGVFFKWRSEGRSFNAYYRRGSAASGLSVKDVPDDALDGVRLVHQSGITTALSESSRELARELAFRARRRGLPLQARLPARSWPMSTGAYAVSTKAISFSKRPVLTSYPTFYTGRVLAMSSSGWERRAHLSRQATASKRSSRLAS